MSLATTPGRCGSFVSSRRARRAIRLATLSADTTALLGRPKRSGARYCAALVKDIAQGAFQVTNGSPPRVSSASADTAGASRPSTSGGGGGPDEESTEDGSWQIGVDPFSQQLILSALTAGGALAIAAFAHLDLSSSFRLDGQALALALQLSSPVLLLLLAVVTPRWAPPFKGSELERLQHNYYMTAQVLQLYLDPDDGADDDDDDAAAGGGGGSVSGEERARVRRRLRLEQTVGWGTISSGLALMQAFTLQPWNPPTANSVLGLGLGSRAVQQLANEFLIRGAGWGLISSWAMGVLAEADTSDGILFFGKVFAGPEAIKYVTGLALVAMGLPGALWEARSVRNFVRASVVGPVRDAAIFCTGNGVDEPAYCDPAGFAMMAARRPANAASVADVVTRTRGWRSGPESSFSSVSSLASMDTADLPVEVVEASQTTTSSSGGSSGGSGGASSGHGTASQGREPAPDAALDRSGQAHAAPGAGQALTGAGAAPEPASAARQEGASASSSPNTVPTPPSGAGGGAGAAASAPAPAAKAPPAVRPLGVGPTLSASSTAFEWDSEDMGVLLRVETLQDKIAFWSALYYQLLVCFAVNGSFLASDANLLASFAAAWLLRTGPLILAELRARAAADAAARSA